MSISALAANAPAPLLPASHSPLGWLTLALFVVALVLVALEERLHLRKSKPVMLAAATIWIAVAIASAGDPAQAQRVSAAFEHGFLEYAQLFFFLVASTAFVEALAERGVFDVLRAALLRRGWSWRGLFWATGLATFALSSVLNNMTTALVMAAVVMAVGGGQRRFVATACVNIVIASNAGGAWSAFGDVTTLMVWQSRHAGFFDFPALFLPALANWLIPAVLMHFSLPRGAPAAESIAVRTKPGAMAVGIAFVAAIAMTVIGAQMFGLPPVFGMLAGLAVLQIVAWRIGIHESFLAAAEHAAPSQDIFRILARNDWDTLLFFYGVLLSVAGLAFVGWLDLLAAASYGALGPSWANTLLGAASAIVDNIPVMSAVLQMNPAMGVDQWLLVTLACGVGGSLLSIGSAAGIALMGSARGTYTFASHLRWSWAIALGYVASILLHLYLNMPAVNP
ncbi:MAG: sodium:proton antiporter NhaD [Proteobacteria bacterium]|nr:sodium:proton antiporter NhaD [Pseudomonadota bacterium]